MELEIKENEIKEATLSDKIRKIPPFRAAEKVNGVSLLTQEDGTIKLSILHSDNSIALYQSSTEASNKKKDQNSSENTCVCICIIL